jgi:hypothetical protein
LQPFASHPAAATLLYYFLSPLKPFRSELRIIDIGIQIGVVRTAHFAKKKIRYPIAGSKAM